MNNKNTIKKILIGLLVAIALLVVYSMLAPKADTIRNGSSLSSLLDSSALGQIEETDTSLANAEILKVLGNIQHIQLNDDIFTNPVFKGLKDSRFTIPKPLQIGRSNPFLPIGFDIIVNTQISEEIQVSDVFGGVHNANPAEDDGFWDDGFGDLDDLDL